MLIRPPNRIFSSGLTISSGGGGELYLFFLSKNLWPQYYQQVSCFVWAKISPRIQQTQSWTIRIVKTLSFWNIACMTFNIQTIPKSIWRPIFCIMYKLTLRVSTVLHQRVRSYKSFTFWKNCSKRGNFQLKESWERCLLKSLTNTTIRVISISKFFYLYFAHALILHVSPWSCWG